MIAYKGRTLYKIKLLNKPIKKGYKVWVLNDSGYIYNWLWHNRIDGSEDISNYSLNIKRVKEKDLIKLI